MKMTGNSFTCLMFAVVATFAGCGPSAELVTFATPESVLCAVGDDVYYVSNINGAPLAKDNNGYISRISADGKGVERFIEGGKQGCVLHAPKGMAISGDYLWVADIDTVRKFDLRTGEGRGATEVPGATFLNDVTAGPDGTIYVSDSGLDAKFEPTGTDAIWSISSGGTATVLIKTPELGHPNGIVARDTDVYVVNWRDGAFFQVDKRGVRMDLGKAPQAQLDGLVRVQPPAGGDTSKSDRPSWYATSWEGKCIYRFDLVGGCTAMPVRLEQPADLGFDARRNQLVIPLFSENRLQTLPL